MFDPPAGGPPLTVHHPKVDGMAPYTCYMANSDAFTPTGRDLYVISFTVDKCSGILVTHKNACKAHSTREGCERGSRCRFYHAPPGKIMSNLPLRAPVPVGVISPMLAANVALRDLIIWRAEDQFAIDKINSSYMNRVIADNQAKRRRKAEAAQQEAEFNAIMAEAAACDEEVAVEPVAKRLCLTIAKEEPLAIDTDIDPPLAISYTDPEATTVGQLETIPVIEPTVELEPPARADADQATCKAEIIIKEEPINAVTVPAIKEEPTDAVDVAKAEEDVAFEDPCSAEIITADGVATLGLIDSI